MGFSLIPDFKFKKFNDVTPDFLADLGIKGVLLDIDNTLEPYENAVPGEHVLSWFRALEEQGIRCAFVSNNGKERVELFNKSLCYPAYYKAGKPFKKKLLLAIRDIGTEKENTIFMGDQVFTDVLAAHFTGIRAILVDPIKDKTDPLTKFKRMLERPVLRKYEKRAKR